MTLTQQLKNLQETQKDIDRAKKLLEANILETQILKMKNPITEEAQKETDRKIDIDLGLAFKKLDFLLTTRQEN